MKNSSISLAGNKPLVGFLSLFSWRFCTVAQAPCDAGHLGGALSAT